MTEPAAKGLPLRNQFITGAVNGQELTQAGAMSPVLIFYKPAIVCHVKSCLLDMIFNLPQNRLGERRILLPAVSSVVA
jgi:hypothetical protein